MPSTSHTDLVAHIVHTADGRLASMTEIERRSELTRDQIRGATRSLIDQGYLLRTDDDPDTGEAVFTTLGATADVGARVDPIWAARDRAAFDRLRQRP